MKSAFAEVAKCQVAYISRILNDDAQLSLEQGDAIAQYLSLTEEESQYFLLMIQFARAGTERLRSHFSKQMETIQKNRLNLKERFNVKMELSKDAQMIYYSSWIYAAVHLCLTVPTLQNREAICRYLNIASTKASQILDFLESTGLAIHEGGRYVVGTSRVHLGNDSPLISKHHTNWRIQAIRSFDREEFQKNEDLHYSSIVSLSHADQLRLKALLVKTIVEFNAIVSPSSEEEVHCLTLDFFKI